MKKILIVFVILVSVVYTSCKENASTKINSANVENAKVRDAKNSLGFPIIEFDTTEYDFGTIKEGDVVEGVFNFKNTGKVDLLLTSVKASCGCTTPDWTKTPIKPGDSGEIKFVFNSARRTGKQSKSITVKSNAEKVTQVIRIKGEVTPKDKQN